MTPNRVRAESKGPACFSVHAEEHDWNRKQGSEENGVHPSLLSVGSPTGPLGKVLENHLGMEEKQKFPRIFSNS